MDTLIDGLYKGFNIHFNFSCVPTVYVQDI